MFKILIGNKISHVILSTRCNQLAVFFRATKRYHTTTGSFQSHPHSIRYDKVIESLKVGTFLKHSVVNRATVGMVIPWRFPMLMGIGKIWGFWSIPTGLWGFYGDFFGQIWDQVKRFKHGVNHRRGQYFVWGWCTFSLKKLTIFFILFLFSRRPHYTGWNC